MYPNRFRKSPSRERRRVKRAAARNAQSSQEEREEVETFGKTEEVDNQIDEIVQKRNVDESVATEH